MKIWGTYDSPEALVIKSKMPQMLKLIEEAEQKLKEDLKMEDFEMYDGDYEYEDGEYLEDEGFESDYYEDWDNLEMGFDPYEGDYTWDC